MLTNSSIMIRDRVPEHATRAERRPAIPDVFTFPPRGEVGAQRRVGRCDSEPAIRLRGQLRAIAIAIQ